MQRSDTRSTTDESQERTAPHSLSDIGSDLQADTATEQSTSSRVGMDGSWFSVKFLLASVLLIGTGAVLGGMIPIVGALGRIGGVFLAAFLLGTVTNTTRYVETGVAGAGVVALSFAIGLLSVGVLPVGLDFLQQYGIGFSALGAAIGGLTAVVGHYFGRDLRSGLTDEIPSKN